jgi:NUMOD4 motif
VFFRVRLSAKVPPEVDHSELLLMREWGELLAGREKMGEEIKEEWRFVVGFEGVYEISCRGRVRRVLQSSGTRSGYLLKPQYRNPNGYPVIMLYRNQKGTPHYLHCLVAEAFPGSRAAGMEVNHKDGNKKIRTCVSSNTSVLLETENMGRIGTA